MSRSSNRPRIDPFRQLAQQAVEVEVTYFLIRDLELPAGCIPATVDSLLCPTLRDGYQSRLFFAAQVSGGPARNWNATGVRILRAKLVRRLLEDPRGSAIGADGVRPSGRAAPRCAVNPADRIRVRLTRALEEQLREDLARPHPFAFERVGFLETGIGAAEDGVGLILLRSYHPVPDDQYLPDEGCGARIGSAAIRAAMQRVIDSGNGAFHVHLHPGYGIPRLSSLDREELPRLVKSLRASGPRAPQGIILLSDDQCAAWVPDRA